MTDIVPAIIPQSFPYLTEELSLVKDDVSLVHIDICDGIFVKNKTWPYVGDAGEFKELMQEEKGLPFWEDVDYEFHLMIDRPELSVENWISVGASSIVIQIEATDKISEIIEICKAAEVAITLALKASTPIESLAPYVADIDGIQCMGSDDLGYHGAVLDETVFEKITKLRTFYPDMSIAVDIGVNEDTAEKFIEAGAHKLISGSAIFRL